jgi:hypothetical protein
VRGDIDFFPVTITGNPPFVWLVVDGWCWFVLREKYCWLVAGGWFVVREKYCWVVADKPSEQAAVLFCFFWLLRPLQSPTKFFNILTLYHLNF